MAITLYGIGPDIDKTRWSELHDVIDRDTVVNMQPTIGGGNRQVVVAAGKAVAAGVLAKNSASVTVTLDTNTSGSPRIDWVVMEIDWSGNLNTGGTIKFVKGTAGVTPVAPALQQDFGTLWQIPLARIFVRNNVTIIQAADFEDVRPGFRKPVRYNVTIATGSVGVGAGPVVRATQDVPDPGWPYMIMAMGSVNFVNNSPGYAALKVLVDGATLTGGRNDAGNTTPAMIRPDVTAVRTGKCTVTMTVEARNTTSLLAFGTEFNGLTLLVIPA